MLGYESMYELINFPGSKKASAKQPTAAAKSGGSSGVCMKLILVLMLVGAVVGALFAFGVVTPDQIPGE